MPTYVYKFVDTGETIEIQQSFTEDTLTEAVHPETGESMAVKKVFQPVGVTFKGAGFYKTDSRPKEGSSSGTSSSADKGSSGPSKPAGGSGEPSSSGASSGSAASGTSGASTSAPSSSGSSD